MAEQLQFAIPTMSDKYNKWLNNNNLLNKMTIQCNKMVDTLNYYCTQ